MAETDFAFISLMIVRPIPVPVDRAIADGQAQVPILSNPQIHSVTTQENQITMCCATKSVPHRSVILTSPELDCCWQTKGRRLLVDSNQTVLVTCSSCSCTLIAVTEFSFH